MAIFLHGAYTPNRALILDLPWDETSSGKSEVRWDVGPI
jgi:hypothetical protein